MIQKAKIYLQSVPNIIGSWKIFKGIGIDIKVQNLHPRLMPQKCWKHFDIFTITINFKLKFWFFKQQDGVFPTV